MRWKKKPRPEWRWRFLLLFPLVLDDGTRILWEWVRCKTTVTREWGGMGAEGADGYTDYYDKAGQLIGRETWSR